MDDRRKVVFVLALSAIVAPFACFAEQPAKIPRIGFLGTSSPRTNPHVTNGFLPGLRDLGYVDGKNINIEWRWTDGRSDRLPFLVADLVSLNVSVIVVSNADAALAARSATTSIPIVTTTVADPVSLGLAKSLAHPGGNVTGLSAFTTDLTRKRLELIKETVPGLSRVAVLRRARSDGPVNPTADVYLKEFDVEAKSLGIQVQVAEFHDASDLEGAFRSAANGRAEALIVLDTTGVYLNRERIVQLATQRNMPLVVAYKDMADLGALMFYGGDDDDRFRRVAGYVARILNGAKPADLPIEQPTKIELVINMRTAKALGIRVPQSILARADRIID